MRSKPMILVALLLTFGSLSDRFGRKGMLLAGLAVFSAASLACGFAIDPAQLIAARAVMGLGADRQPSPRCEQ
jgi:MFS family permease